MARIWQEAMFHLKPMGQGFKRASLNKMKKETAYIWKSPSINTKYKRGQVWENIMQSHPHKMTQRHTMFVSVKYHIDLLPPTHYRKLEQETEKTKYIYKYSPSYLFVHLNVEPVGHFIVLWRQTQTTEVSLGFYTQHTPTFGRLIEHLLLSVAAYPAVCRCVFHENKRRKRVFVNV